MRRSPFPSALSVGMPPIGMDRVLASYEPCWNPQQVSRGARAFIPSTSLGMSHSCSIPESSSVPSFIMSHTFAGAQILQQDGSVTNIVQAAGDKLYFTADGQSTPCSDSNKLPFEVLTRTPTGRAWHETGFPREVQRCSRDEHPDRLRLKSSADSS